MLPWPFPQELIPPQKSVTARNLPMPSSTGKYGGDEPQKVVEAKNENEVGSVMACGAGNAMMEPTNTESMKSVFSRSPSAKTTLQRRQLL